MSTVPGRIETGDGALTVRRAWPGRDGRLTIEATDDAGRIRAGILRAGTLLIEPYASDPVLPGLADLLAFPTAPEPLASTPTLLVHRYKRRAVVYTGGPGGARYTKLLTPGKAERIASVSQRMHRLGADAGIAVPEVVDAGADRLVFAPLQGRSFHDHGGGGDADAWTAGWKQWEQRWPQLVTSSTNSVLLPSYSAPDEARTLTGWVDHAVAFDALGVPAQRLRELLETVVDALLDKPAGRTGLSHRDLHDKQLFYAPDANRLGLLDFDTAASAELALDVANLGVHLELRRDQNRISAAAFLSARRSIATVQRRLELDPARIASYEGATRLRLICLYAFRPGWEALAARWLARALQQLDDKTLMRSSSTHHRPDGY